MCEKFNPTPFHALLFLLANFLQCIVIVTQAVYDCSKSISFLDSWKGVSTFNSLMHCFVETFIAAKLTITTGMMMHTNTTSQHRDRTSE